MTTKAWALKFPPRVVLRGLVLLTLLSVGWSVAAAQSAAEISTAKPQLTTETANLETPASTNTSPTAPAFRVEKLSVATGAELLTIFGRVDGLRDSSSPEVPLVTVLRDTLGDDNPENDRLRYVWMLTYTQPSMAKRVAAAIPFLYRSVGNKKNISGPPSPILNLSHAQRATWSKFFWWGVQNAFLDTYGLPLKVSTRTYRQNL